ncbi:ribonuclease H-like domain-containing protein [Tanacetum coccineum]|uniref:Ribonuclease H-like domain-containing protein n=1 Tax=Tanacetum coccineum TaxID=301880 RepID=A0ABQ4Z7Q0_9ASTR
MWKVTPPLPIPNGVNLMISSRCDSLQEQVVTTPGNAKALWDHLKNLFHDNKDARAINLDNELRSIKIGKMTVNEYCTKIQAMANRLKNLDCEVSYKNMVIFAVNGLDSRFTTLAEIIRHREPLPTFETVRNMLLLKESSFNDDSTSTTFESSSSSPTILMASSSSNTKGNTNTQSKYQNLPQLCNHFPRGTCKFGDRCKFIHDHRNRAGLNAKNNTHRAAVSGQNNWDCGFDTSPNSQAYRLAHTRSMSYQPQALISPVYYTASDPGTLAQPVQHTQPQPTISAHQPAVYMAHQQVLPGQPMSQSNSNGILGAASVLYASQPTSLPNARNLSTIFNKRLFPSIHVGDGNSIFVTNTGHSIIPTFHRPLHLHNVLVTPNIIKNLISVRQFTRDNNCTIEFDAFGFSVKDFLTRHILFRCDSSGDLYPVTKLSNLPVAFVSTSSSTWHQRLGHPGDEVLRSLTSRRFISCNKEKSSHVCHACQLGKHVKLLFHSSNSIATKCFDIIHSDLWTSPIVSSSDFKYQSRFHVKAGHVRVLHVPSRFQYADIFTKVFPQLCLKIFAPA